MKPYYEQNGITIICGDCRMILPGPQADVLVTDPPYGIRYHSSHQRTEGFAASIAGDEDTQLRDFVLKCWGEKPALIFGSWRKAPPVGTRMVLQWDQGDALGMGDLSLPWKPCWQEIYVLGSGFSGRRTSDELRHNPPVQSMAKNGRTHPHEKPVRLIRQLLEKCPPGVVLDPFMGTGATLLAARDLGRKAIGIEIVEQYCEIAAKRLAQQLLPSGKQ